MDDVNYPENSFHFNDHSLLISAGAPDRSIRIVAT